MAKYAQSGPDYRFLSGRKDIDASPHPAKGWFCHPKADVAVFRLGPHERCNDPDDGTFKYAVISTSSFAPTATAISLGEDVLFVGYPDGLIDPAS
ncbi:MAG TPA: hypothetical protein VHC70_08345, partial [Phycisphaerales bacterium]|nr:hypothetical protein [Phycisphaerales bacterium]